MKYALLIHPNDEQWDERSPAEQQAIYGEYFAISETPGVFGGAELEPVSAATTVRVADGRTPTTDGPFAETKEGLGGFFLFERDFIDKYLTDDPSVMLEHAPLQQLARDGGLGIFRHEGFWMGMDTFRDWKELNGLWDAGAAEWKVWND